MSVLDIVHLIVELIEERTLWLYAAAGLMILVFLRAFISARRQRNNTIFTIDREVAAHREHRAISGIGAMLGIIVVIAGLKQYVLPEIELPEAGPTPTLTLPLPSPTPTVTPTIEIEIAPEEGEEDVPPTPAPTATPYAEPTPEAVPTPEPPPVAPAACPDPNVRITQPGQGATLSGTISVVGTADHAQFQFYKVEWGQGHDPTAWHVIGDVRHQVVHSGTLVSFNSAAMPNGPITLQLVVVDVTGNYPPPCRVRVTVQN